MHFDWYQATIPSPPPFIIDTLGQSLGAADLRDDPGRNGYATRTSLIDGDGDVLAAILHGGNHERPNVQGTGHDAPAVADAIRSHFPAHFVTRCDVAEDMIGDGSFDQLLPVCRATARRNGAKGRSIVPDDVEDGRTYYIGSPTSEVSARLYDKTAERRAKLPAECHPDIPQDWTRLELQVRPKRARREALARCDPDAVWGASRWSQQLALEVFALELDRIEAPRFPSSDAQTFQHMLAQYAATLARLGDQWGDTVVLRRIADAMASARSKADL